MGLCFARAQGCQRRLQEGGTRPCVPGQLPSLMPDAKTDLGRQHQRGDEQHQGGQCFRIVCSHLLTPKPPSVPAALMEKICSLLSPRLQIKTRAVVQLPPGKQTGNPGDISERSNRNHIQQEFSSHRRIQVQLIHVHYFHCFLPGSGGHQ